MTSKGNIELAFRNAIKAHVCPSCEAHFTDGAVDWGNAWREGYVDCSLEHDEVLRDGPFKIKCERCDKRWQCCYFGDTVKEYKAQQKR